MILRINTFYRIHKGLRAFFYETALKLQQTDCDDIHSISSIANQMEEGLELLAAHGAAEDRWLIFPLVQEYEYLTKHFTKDHEEGELMNEQVSNLIYKFRTCAELQERYELHKELQIRFTEMIAFNLQHMSAEENQLNSVLWRHYTDEQIGEIEKIIIQRSSDRNLKISAKWMMRGLNNLEITDWLREVYRKNTLAYSNLCSLAKNELSEERWGIICNRIPIVSEIRISEIVSR